MLNIAKGTFGRGLLLARPSIFKMFETPLRIAEFSQSESSNTTAPPEKKTVLKFGEAFVSYSDRKKEFKIVKVKGDPEPDSAKTPEEDDPIDVETSLTKKKQSNLIGNNAKDMVAASNQLEQKDLASVASGEIEKPGVRLTKVLSRMGVASRRKSEEMIARGLVYVNGEQITQNTLVTELDKITIAKGQELKRFTVENTKLWMFYKPAGLICSHDDPDKRKSVFDYLREKGFKQDEHMISVGRLDYYSEGLLLLTNNGELAHIMENPSSNIPRRYQVRVYGYLDEKKIEKLRTGMEIAGQFYGPYDVEVLKSSGRNTWLYLTLKTGKNREIRRCMQKLDLRVNRLFRDRYGPYWLKGMNAGDLKEVEVYPDLKNQLVKATEIKFKEPIQLEPENPPGVHNMYIKRLEEKLAVHKAQKEAEELKEIEKKKRRRERMYGPRKKTNRTTETKSKFASKLSPRGNKLASKLKSGKEDKPKFQRSKLKSKFSTKKKA